MQLNKIIQKNYTSFSLYYQIKLPLDLEISIPSDDPVRLVSTFVEEMDLSELYKTYGRIRKNQATPRQMLKLVIYAAMNRIYSSRDIRKACKRDINFMYLLEGMPAPDHATIARFISLHFSACAKVLLAQMSDLLYLLGEISGKTIFIDGTKIESAANKYTFVWKRAIISMKSKKKFMILWVLLIAVLFAGSLLTAPPGKAETIQTAMRDAVLHEENQISLFGWKNVNPGLISAMTVSAILLIAAACIRVFVIPKFKLVPGRFQLLLEQAVNLFDGMAKTSSPQRNGFLGAYIFGAGAYIFVGTLFELLGLQAVTTTGRSVTLPAPLSDVNGAIALGCLSYLVILSGGIVGNGLKGVGKTLKEFSLPISMSFRLFGALLSGLLVTELVYYYVQLSYVLPVLVGVLFTLLHALIQAYVLTMLTALFYGEVSEHPEPASGRA